MPRNYHPFRPHTSTNSRFPFSQSEIEGINYVVANLGIGQDVQNLKNNDIQVQYREIIDISAGTTGSISFPGSSILNEEVLGAFDNATLSTLDGSGKLTYESPRDVNNNPITATLDSAGNWVATTTYPDPVALVFNVDTSQIDYATWSAAEKQKVIDLYNKTIPHAFEIPFDDSAYFYNAPNVQDFVERIEFTNTVRVRSLNQLPTPVAGVITLSTPDIVYIFGNDVDLGSNRIVIGANNIKIQGLGTEIVTISSTTTGPLISGNTQGLIVQRLTLSAPNSTYAMELIGSGIEVVSLETTSIPEPISSIA